MIFPPPLRPGDTIAVVAPSSPFDRKAALEGIAWLESRYRVRYRASMFACEGYLAGSDERRTTELMRALAADVRAVVAARGGYGLSRIAHLVDWTLARSSPRWLVGFSDFTVLLAEAWKRGLASIHGEMVGSLGKADAPAREAWIAALEKPHEPRTFRGLMPWRRGRAKGRLVGGNLAMLHSCAAAGRLRIPKGAIVFLEDIGERPYRVDRMLSDLMHGGYLRTAAGVLVGDFTNCGPGADGTRVEDVVRERLSRLGVPIAAGLPVGHGQHNESVVLLRRAELDASRGVCVLP